jgi:protein-disulfide isomerase
MSPNTKRVAAGILLTLLPVGGVYWARQSTWGAVAAAPKARQTGDPQAPVVMVEYSDFQCPMCARVQPALHRLLEVYKGKVRLIYKYYPLTSIHRNALPAAIAAECAAQQDQFWPYHDRLFTTQPQWAPLSDPTTAYMAIAQELRLNADTFNACRADPSTEKTIMRDHAEAKNRQITATPTLFIGEERLVGTVIETDGARMVERVLRRQR